MTLNLILIIILVYHVFYSFHINSSWLIGKLLQRHINLLATFLLCKKLLNQILAFLVSLFKHLFGHHSLLILLLTINCYVKLIFVVSIRSPFKQVHLGYKKQNFLHSLNVKLFAHDVSNCHQDIIQLGKVTFNTVNIQVLI